MNLERNIFYGLKDTKILPFGYLSYLNVFDIPFLFFTEDLYFFTQYFKILKWNEYKVGFVGVIIAFNKNKAKWKYRNILFGRLYIRARIVKTNIYLKFLFSCAIFYTWQIISIHKYFLHKNRSSQGWWNVLKCRVSYINKCILHNSKGTHIFITYFVYSFPHEYYD